MVRSSIERPINALLVPWNDDVGRLASLAQDVSAVNAVQVLEWVVTLDMDEGSLTHAVAAHPYTVSSLIPFQVWVVARLDASIQIWLRDTGSLSSLGRQEHTINLKSRHSRRDCFRFIVFRHLHFDVVDTIVS